MTGADAGHPVGPLSFGGLALENNLFQAPLAGFSALPFRLLTWRLGRPGLLATEMISANALRQNVDAQAYYLARADEEGPLSFQLWGACPEAIGEAARRATESGADAVDLNCGCPVRKVRAAGAGSKLMEDPPLIGRLVAAMRRNTARPVTVKLRVGPGASVFNAVEIARIAWREGADLLAVHGRHAGEAYGTPCRYGEIAKVVAAVGIPVIGNGDVRDGDSALRMFRETGCAGVMVGRACLGAPWVFARIKAECAGEAWQPPAPEDVGRALLEHHDSLARLGGAEKAIRHCRKLGAFYSKGFRGAREFRDQLNFCHTRDDLARLVDRCFSSRYTTLSSSTRLAGSRRATSGIS